MAEAGRRGWDGQTGCLLCRDPRDKPAARLVCGRWSCPLWRVVPAGVRWFGHLCRPRVDKNVDNGSGSGGDGGGGSSGRG